jgi:hypothetical protein
LKANPLSSSLSRQDFTKPGNTVNSQNQELNRDWKTEYEIKNGIRINKRSVAALKSIVDQL